MILANENQQIFSFFPIAFLFKFKKSHYNTGTAACCLCPTNLLVKFYCKIKQPAPSNPSFCCWNHDLLDLLCHWFQRNISNHPKRFFLKSWFVIFGEFPINCWIGYCAVLWISVSSGINGTTTEVLANSMLKSDNNTTIITSVALV